MTSISKAIGSLVGSAIGLFVVWGVLPDTFSADYASVIDAAVLLVSTFLGTYFAPPNAE